MENNYFRIADHNICIRFADTQVNNMQLMPSYEPFRISGEALTDELLFTITVDDATPYTEADVLHESDTGNGIIYVFRLADNGYQYIIRDINKRNCCLLVCNKDFSQCRCALKGNTLMRTYGLNAALMLTFAFASSYHDTLLLHASCIAHGEWAYPFTAKSGTGKSTHTSLWLKHIEGSELLNDDNPVVRILSDGLPYIYGTPWSGKTPCYRNRRLRLGAMTKIERDDHNWIEQLKTAEALVMMLPNLSTMKWDKEVYLSNCNTIGRIIETTPIYTLHCLPDEEAAQLSFKILKRSC